jgi:diguanylate cyclase (GGDEF)-like protein
MPPTVLRRVDTHELRRALATAQARVADLEAELADRSRHDACTGLLTLEAFRTEAHATLSASAGAPVALALVDIDGFRALNAAHGAPAGDAALAAFAARLRRLVRAGDVLARTGADEIAVLMPGTGLDGARACCERLIALLADTAVAPAGAISVSAGVAAASTAATVDALLAEAAEGVDLARAEGGARAIAHIRGEAGAGRLPRHADVIEALSTALAERDRYTGEHSACVVDLTRDVARDLGLAEAEVERIAAAALVHDVGKVGIPDRILHKPEPLDDADWEVMREHPAIGERILRTVPGMGAVARIVRHEHERFDGGGYPDGLAGEQIPIGSRVILACDAYHAMTSDRPYRRAMGHADALAELTRSAGTQFDPHVVSALLGRLATDGAAGAALSARAS